MSKPYKKNAAMLKWSATRETERGRRSMSNAPNGVYDFKSVGEIYRKVLGGNPFGIEQDKPLPPEVKCIHCGSKLQDGLYAHCSGACNFV